MVKIKKIKKIGYEPVYNMEVKKYHNFAINGGLIVHNCLDALRYAYEDESKDLRITAGKRI